MARELPKLGDRIPVEKLHVSETNVNVDEPFGESEEDKKLIANLRAGKKIVQKFLARPEGDGYGVYVGRRRFLGKKAVGAKFFVVGQDCLIEDVSDEEAEEASWTENFKEFHKGMNPITRAKRLNRIVSRSPRGIRGYARRSGIPPSSLSEYLKVLELSPKMQEALVKGSLSYTDGLMVTRMRLGSMLQDELTEVLETQGLEAFKKELARVSEGKGRRGIPPGVYEIDRVIWDKRNREEMKRREIVTKASERMGFDKVPEYIKDFITRRIDEIAKEAA